MKTKIFCIAATLMLTTTAHGGGMNDDPFLTMLTVDQFEIRAGEGDTPLVWDAEGWLGKDLNKLWIKTDGNMPMARLKRQKYRLSTVVPLHPSGIYRQDGSVISVLHLIVTGSPLESKDLPPIILMWMLPSLWGKTAVPQQGCSLSMNLCLPSG